MSQMNGQDVGFRGFQHTDQFLQLKSSLLKQKRLFEDSEFPASNASIGSNSGRYEWKRPGEICTNPTFIEGDMNKSDLFQGDLNNCWFIAAAACMATAHEALLQRCIPPNQEFDNNYAGIFCFHFWRFGNIAEIIIDDRLPTVNGRLVFGSNRAQPNEFWVPLFEKAYAKLNGSYKNLNGGLTNDALVDFTGGISEIIKLQDRNQPEFFDELYDMMKRSSLLGAHISGDFIDTAPLPSGLYSGHAYSVINIVKLKHKEALTRLFQLRNPWGKKEWKGAWSDDSVEWKQIPNDAKNSLNMINQEDGDFWMCYEDFMGHFEYVTICHLTPESTKATFSKDKMLWKVQSFQGKWVKGFSAGGCGNKPYEDLFWRNPQAAVTVDPSSKSGRSSMVISLLQNSASHVTNFPINFKVYKLKMATTQLLNAQNEFSLATHVSHPSNRFTNLREVSDHFAVGPGQYVIIPSTFEPNQESEFLLRVFTDDAAEFRAVDMPTTLRKENSPQDMDFEKIFEKATGGDSKMDAQELVNAANEVLTKDGIYWTIALETARSLIHLADNEQSGTISLIGFRKIMKELITWKEKFKTFDKDISGSIDTFELAQVFQSTGLNLSRKVQEAIFRRYGGKKCRLSFEDFVHSHCRLIALYGAFTKYSDDGVRGRAHLNMEDWLSTLAYY